MRHMPKAINTLTPELRSSLLNSISALTEFLDNIECGCSYWVDFEGRSHTADIGYVSEFLEDLEKYLKGECEDQSDQIVLTKPFRYRIVTIDKNGNQKQDYCDMYHMRRTKIHLCTGKEKTETLLLSSLTFCQIEDTFKGEIAYCYQKN